MSNPENILNNYTSYSYHHILIAANSTAVLEYVSSSDFEITKYFRQSSTRSKLDVARDVHNIPNVGSFVVVLNSTQDTDFYIDDLTWSTAVIPSKADTRMNYTVSGVEGSMKIYEPNGARFFGYLHSVFNALQCDPIGVVFILKTIFIGQLPPDSDINPERNREVFSVKPLGLTFYDIVNSFEATGSVYDISFVGISNGTTKLAPFMQVTPGTASIQVQAKDTLSAVIKRYEQQLNNESIKSYDQYVEQAKVELKKDVIKNPRVSYRIILDSVYESAEYKIENSINERNSEKGDTSSGTLSVSSTSNIEALLDVIMGSCSLVVKEADQGEVKITLVNEKYKYKIYTTFDSSASDVQIINAAKGQEYGKAEVVIKIVRYKVIEPHLNAEALLANANPGNKIEFDYMFTGNNIDIVSLDMKMDVGLALFQLMKPVSNVKGHVGQVKGLKDNVQTAGSAVSGSNPFFQLNEHTPIFPSKGTFNAADVNIRPSPLEYMNFRQLLNKVSAFSAVNTKLVIRGNPRLLDNMITLPSDIKNASSRINKGVAGQSVAADWLTVPALVKINIRMVSDDLLDNPDNAVHYTEPFWYNGWNQIVTIDQKFSGGEFTQELDLVALIQEADIKGIFANKADEDPKEVAKQSAAEWEAEAEKRIQATAESEFAGEINKKLKEKPPTFVEQKDTPGDNKISDIQESFGIRK